MISLLLNLLNCSILIFVIYYIIHNKRDNALLWFSIVMLYFINIPLLYDSAMLLYYGDFNYETIQKANNNYWFKGSYKYLNKISIHSLIFNFLVCLTYIIINPIKKIKENIPEDKIFMDSTLLSGIPWWLCFTISITALLLFLYTNQIFSITHIGTGKWYLNKIHSPALILLSTILISLSPVAVLKGLCEKKWSLAILCILPTITIGYITDARSLVISIGFYFLFYLIWKVEKFHLRTIAFYIIALFFISYIFTSWRGGYGLFYPKAKDLSYTDLFYSYYFQNNISTKGSNTIRLLLTGFYDYNAKDVTVALAHYKFNENWGSLHPTILGWAFLDLGRMFWLLSIIWGAIIAICDIIRYKLPSYINYGFLSFIFSFLSVSIRGSVQFAYASLIYPLILIFIYYVIHIKLKLL